MFDDAIDSRITFFLGEHLLSATALHYRGKFFMFDRRTHCVYRGDHFTFSTADAVHNPESDGEAQSFAAAFNSFKRVQEAWILNFRAPATSASAPSFPPRQSSQPSIRRKLISPPRQPQRQAFHIGDCVYEFVGVLR